MKRCPNGHENEDWRTTCKTCYLALEEVEPPVPPPVPPDPEPPPPPPAPAPAPEVELVTVRVTVEPGTDAFCDVRVRNVGSADDTIALQVEGEPSAWALPEPQSLVLSPGTEGTARLAFRLPASATVPPGEHPLRLRATSGASGASTVASGTVLIPGATPPPVDDDDGAVPPWVRPAALAAVIVVAIVVVAALATGDGELTNTTPPSIDGTPTALETLVADPGEWSMEDLDFAFQWQRCDAAGGPCQEVEGAVLPSYQAGNEDVGMSVRVEVRAAAGDREATAVSDPTAPIEAVPPIGITMPSVVGFTRSDAVAALNPNFQVAVITAGPQSDSCNPVVESQAPGPGTLVTQGEQVVITTRPPKPLFECLDILPPVRELPFLVPDEPQFLLPEGDLPGS